MHFSAVSDWETKLVRVCVCGCIMRGFSAERGVISMRMFGCGESYSLSPLSFHLKQYCTLDRSACVPSLWASAFCLHLLCSAPFIGSTTAETNPPRWVPPVHAGRISASSGAAPIRRPLASARRPRAAAIHYRRSVCVACRPCRSAAAGRRRSSCG